MYVARMKDSISTEFCFVYPPRNKCLQTSEPRSESSLYMLWQGEGKFVPVF